jgi:hypothetical protein
VKLRVAQPDSCARRSSPSVRLVSRICDCRLQLVESSRKALPVSREQLSFFLPSFSGPPFFWLSVQPLFWQPVLVVMGQQSSSRSTLPVQFSWRAGPHESKSMQSERQRWEQSRHRLRRRRDFRR